MQKRFRQFTQDAKDRSSSKDKKSTLSVGEDGKSTASLRGRVDTSYQVMGSARAALICKVGCHGNSSCHNARHQRECISFLI
jgi:hypothetical protein